MPASVAGIESYLGSGLVKGIGPRLAERIVALFGERTFAVIEQQPERLREVPGIGPDRTRKISAAWDEQKQVKQIMVFLHSHGVSTNLAVKIYKTYGEAALETVAPSAWPCAIIRSPSASRRWSGGWGNDLCGETQNRYRKEKYA